MTKINPSAGALSIMEMNGGRLQHVQKGADYMRFLSELQSRWGDRVFVVEDLEKGNFAICGREGSREYIIFHTDQLNDRTIERIYAADQADRGYEDVVAFLEKSWDAEDAAEDARFSEIVAEAGPRLAHAFKKDGLIDHDNIYGPRTKRSTRAVRRGR
jgi:hypothetical protein